MKLFILLAVAAVALAQMPLPLGYEVNPWANSDMVDPSNPWTSNPWTSHHQKWTDFIGKMGGIYGNSKYPFTAPFPYGAGMPSYGPYVRYGNTIVPITYRPFPYSHRTVSPYITPFAPFGSMGGQISDPSTFNPTYNPMGSNLYNPSVVDPRWTTYPDIVNPYENDINTMSPYTGMETSNGGFTPYSHAALFNLITRGGVGKLDLYSKLILGRTTGLSRKMKEVCPEVDGGLSYVSCLSDAHSKTFRCLKGVESHPRFHTCTHKPIVKKAMRDWYVNDFNWHKEVVKCLSTTTYTDKTIERISGGVPQLPIEPTEFDIDSSSSSSSDDDEFGTTKSTSNYNVDFGVSTKKCFYKLRKETSKCQQAASLCPKFNKCYVHPIIKTLELRKHTKQAKFVKLLDGCLAGSYIPDEIVPEEQTPFAPDAVYPDLML